MPKLQKILMKYGLLGLIVALVLPLVQGFIPPIFTIGPVSVGAVLSAGIAVYVADLVIKNVLKIRG